LSGRQREIPTVPADIIARTLDDKRRLTTPDSVAPRTSVTIQAFGDGAWLIRELKPDTTLRMVLIPVIDKLPDDPEWDKVEAKVGRMVAKRIRIEAE
jgi:hypothetical protein